MGVAIVWMAGLQTRVVWTSTNVYHRMRVIIPLKVVSTLTGHMHVPAKTDSYEMPAKLAKVCEILTFSS